jgi:hypothetical protein
LSSKFVLKILYFSKSPFVYLHSKSPSNSSVVGTIAVDQLTVKLSKGVVMRVREQISTFPIDYSKSVSRVYQDVVSVARSRQVCIYWFWKHCLLLPILPGDGQIHIHIGNPVGREPVSYE